MFPLTILGVDLTVTVLNIPFHADFNITVGEEETAPTTAKA